MQINDRLKDRQIVVNLTKAAKDYIINQSYDENFGARPIKRYVSDKVETLIAMKLIDNSIAENTQITIDLDNHNELYLKGNA